MKTFRTEKYGFEIDVPADWQCRPTGFLSRFIARLRLPVAAQLVCRGPDNHYLNFVIGPLHPEPTVEETEDFFKQFASFSGHTDLHTGAISVRNKDHFWARYRMRNGMRSKKYSLVFENMEYAVTCFLGSDDKEAAQREPLYDEVLSTFRVIHRD